MPRLPKLNLSVLTSEQLAEHNRILETRGSVPEPHKVWILNPGLARHASDFGYYLLKQSALPPHLYEMAVLLVARFWDAEYVVRRHAQSAVAVGLAENIVSAIREGREPEFGPEQQTEAALFSFVTGVLTRHEVSREVYERARTALGENGIIDLTALVGYIGITSATVRVFELE